MAPNGVDFFFCSKADVLAFVIADISSERLKTRDQNSRQNKPAWRDRLGPLTFEESWQTL